MEEPELAGRPRAPAVVRVRVADMEWFQGFAAAVLDLLLEVEGEQVLVTCRMQDAAAAVRAASGGTIGPAA